MNDFDVARIRARLPALASGVAFFDGPGGTQLPDVVADAMRTAMTEPLSNRGTMTQSERNAESIVHGSRLAAADLLGCDPAGVVFSRSMTEATFMVARTLANDWGPGDRVVVTDLDHDANVRPWVTYAEKAGAEVAWARLDPTTGELPTGHIVDQITDDTRLVAVTGASNVVGTRPDLPAIAEAAHAVNALFFVDGVHLTAHAPIDVEQIGADFYACSAYKFLGPHLGIVAASRALWESLHPDKLAPSTEQVPERFELGTLPYELLAGLIAAVDVLADLVPGGETSMTRRDRLVRSMAALAKHEDRLHARLRSALEELPGITMYANARRRTPTEFLTFEGWDSAEVAHRLADKQINAPAGSFYAYEPCRSLGLGSGGAIRAGLAPYTDESDVDRLIAALRDIVVT
ncbi:MAG: cysteine desulfurase-like protein [bacterium]|nr:cysteine desulfurase-like protein [bacterium]MCP4894264.1 cysteine desulfurase-like protein [Actinomycetales bacterium]